MSGKRFDKVNIEVSNICNLQCSFCPEVIRPKQIMSVPFFARVVSEVAPICEQICLHLMGDPLVHPELPELLSLCGQHDTRVHFVTNGVLLNERSTQWLLHPVIRQVNFSLHSFHDNYGDKDPSLYLERIFAFVDRAATERSDLFINFRLWNLDSAQGRVRHQGRIAELIEKKYGCSLPQKVDVTQQKGYRIGPRLFLHYDTEFVWPSLALPQLSEHGKCYGLSNHFGILVDGTVVPCCLDKEGAIPLGNLNNSSLAEILGGARALKILQGFKTGNLVEELCRRCQYIERFQDKKIKTRTSLPPGLTAH